VLDGFDSENEQFIPYLTSVRWKPRCSKLRGIPAVINSVIEQFVLYYFPYRHLLGVLLGNDNIVNILARHVHDP
jgi:hypothetical protein